jgi:glycosyltransferase involved in cell wall biosynthesis
MNADKVTVIINNRDLLEWPRQMCACIEGMTDLHEIVIIDNGSTYRPLLAWYKEIPHRVVFLENLGHKAPWTSGVLETLETDYYVVTDPDLDLSAVPADCLVRLRTILTKYPLLGKIGLGLVTSDIPADSPYLQHVQSYEALLQKGEVLDEKIALAAVDTTFALYDKRNLREYKITGARTSAPYVARHLPWYVVTPEGEFKHYLDHAAASSCSYKNFVHYRAPNRLRELYGEHRGKVSTKWASYFDIYHKRLKGLADRPIRMLEIGVQNGGSLDIWAKYFSQAVSIIGCDINPACGRLSYDDPRIAVVVGDANSPEVYRSIVQKAGGLFDLIIDDGSHNSLHVVSNFVNYFPLLAPGGIYIAEDMHCAYWPEYDGGYFNQRSAASFFKCLFDLVNIEHCRADFSPQQLFQTFFRPEQLPACLTDGSVYSASAYNSVYVVEKASETAKPLLGSVVVVGTEAAADARVFAAIAQRPREG